MEKLILVRPNVQLLAKFRDNEKCAPASDFLTLQNITENVIANIEHIFALSAATWVELLQLISYYINQVVLYY